MKVKHESARSTKIYVPFDGLKQIDDQGVAEVSDKCAETLLKCGTGWSVIGGTPEPAAEPELDDDSPEATRARLEKMTAAELKELAKEAAVADEEIKAATTKKALVDLMMSKFTEVAAEPAVKETVEAESHEGEAEEKADPEEIDEPVGETAVGAEEAEVEAEEIDEPEEA